MLISITFTAKTYDRPVSFICLLQKPNPETSASFLSRLTFAWLDPLIWKGYRRPLVQDDMWSLQYENSTSTIVGRWDKNWKKTIRKAEKLVFRPAKNRNWFYFWYCL